MPATSSSSVIRASSASVVWVQFCLTVNLCEHLFAGLVELVSGIVRSVEVWQLVACDENGVLGALYLLEPVRAGRVVV
jgi:hypothetical protein